MTNMIKIKADLNKLLDANITNKKIFELFDFIFSKENNNIDYLMLYSRFIWRTYYGMTKNKVYLNKSKDILFKIIKIYNNTKINEEKLLFPKFCTYAWLWIIYWYLWEYNKSDLFFLKSKDFNLSIDDKKQLDEWICWVILKRSLYKEVLEILFNYNINDLRYRSIWYIVISCYNIWDYNKFKFYINKYIYRYLLEKEYFFIEFKEKIYVLTLISDLDKIKINIRVKWLNKNLKLKLILVNNMNELMDKLYLLCMEYPLKFYWTEWVDKYISLYFNKYYEQ